MQCSLVLLSDNQSEMLRFREGVYTVSYNIVLSVWPNAEAVEFVSNEGARCFYYEGFPFCLMYLACVAVSHSLLSLLSPS